MLMLGLILLIVGWLLGIGILETLGVICVAIGLILLLVDAPRGPFNGRWY